MSITSAVFDTLPLQLSHIEIRVTDLHSMVNFYTDVLGFSVTDSSEGDDGMVFLSTSPDDHHQLVLASSATTGTPDRIDHIAFRVRSLAELKNLHTRLVSRRLETVCHGTSWSLYIRDPENNRLELFADTPWHAAQPARWPIDLADDEETLLQETRDHIQNMAASHSPDDQFLH